MTNLILHIYDLNYIMYDKHNLILYLKAQGAYYTQEISNNLNIATGNTISERYDQF